MAGADETPTNGSPANGSPASGAPARGTPARDPPAGDPLAQGDRFELRVTPDPYVTIRYAGASGDFNPIHIDEEFARGVGLPGRILHGLWSMAQVARAATDAAGGDPLALRSLSVAFRGMGRIGEEIVISGEVKAVSDGTATARIDAVQGDARLVKGASAELRV